MLFGHIVYNHDSTSSLVVLLSDGSISLLTGCIPDLEFDFFAVHIDSLRGKLDADGWFIGSVEFVLGVSDENVGFSDTGVSDDDDFEKILNIHCYFYLFFAVFIF